MNDSMQPVEIRVCCLPELPGVSSKSHAILPCPGWKASTRQTNESSLFLSTPKNGSDSGFGLHLQLIFGATTHGRDQIFLCWTASVYLRDGDKWKAILHAQSDVVDRGAIIPIPERENTIPQKSRI